MCGVVGFVDFNKKLKVEDLDLLIDGLSHRGPDDNGNFFINTQTSNIGIGHTRLVKIALSLLTKPAIVHPTTPNP